MVIQAIRRSFGKDICMAADSNACGSGVVESCLTGKSKKFEPKPLLPKVLQGFTSSEGGRLMRQFAAARGWSRAG